MVVWVGGCGGSQGLHSLNPTTVLVVLLLGLWLLLGCDNIEYNATVFSQTYWYVKMSSKFLPCSLDFNNFNLIQFV